MYGGGAIRSDKSYIDAAPQYGQILARDIETELDLRYAFGPVRDQKGQSTCVAFAAAATLEWFAYLDGGRLYMSPQFIYNNRANAGAGMGVADLVKILTDKGDPYERDYPYGRIEPHDKIPAPVVESALQWRIRSAALVTSVAALKAAISENGPAFMIFPMYNHSARPWLQDSGEKQIDGHAMSIVGYNDHAFILRNSWGPKWGNGGYCEYSFAEWGAHWEIWTFIDEPKYHPVHIESDPRPTDKEDHHCKCVLA